MKNNQTEPRILIIYFSLSGQSRGLINLLAAGMRSEGAVVYIEQLRAQKRIPFPFSGIMQTLWMMIATFFRLRIPILTPSAHCFDEYDLVVLAGPTWSYNPSGPVLYLLDNYGAQLFNGRSVMPLLSCRGYYRIHNGILRWQLKRCGATLEKSMIYCHPVREPWSTIGVFLKSAGYRPETFAVLKKHYAHFGHTTEQLHHIRDKGSRIASQLTTGCS